MPIVSSSIVEDAPQIDGRRWITEAHTDHLGVEHRRTYVAGVGVDAVAALADFAVRLVEHLRQAEIDRNIGSVAAGNPALRFDHSTAADARQALRAAYARSTRAEAANIATFLLTLTDSQLKTITGLADVTAFKARAQAMADAQAVVVAATGE